MDRLPGEVIMLILDLLPWYQLAPYSTISRTWQAQVEARTFQRVRAYSDRLHQFETALGDGHGARRRGLRVFQFRIVLPSNSRSRIEHKDNQARFRAAITSMFECLATWNDWSCNTQQGALKLSIDFKYTDGLDYPRWLFKMDPDTVSKLPLLRHVNHVSICESSTNSHETLPTVWSQLLTRLPRLESLDLFYRDTWPKRQAGFRRRLAKGILRLQNIPTLKRLRLEVTNREEPWNHSYQLPILADQDGVDVLSEAIRTLAEQDKLTDLTMRSVSISRDLFEDMRRPRKTSLSECKELTRKPWPSLKRFSIHTTIDGPHGTWYFTGSPRAVSVGSRDGGSDSEGEYRYREMYDPSSWFQVEEDGDNKDEDRATGTDRSSVTSEEIDDDVVAHQNTRATNNPYNPERPFHPWRNRPDQDALNPLLLSMTEALSRMPALESAELFVQGENRFYDCWPGLVTVRCARPGVPYLETEVRNLEGYWVQDMSLARWLVSVDLSADWTPSVQIKDAARRFVGRLGKIALVKTKYRSMGESILNETLL